MSKSIIVSVLAASPDPQVTGPVIWKVGSPVPLPGPTPGPGEVQLPDNTTQIMRMFLIDGIVEVFALPVPGSELDQIKQGMVFKIMPLSIRTIMSIARFDHWQELMDEAAEAEDYEEGEEEEDEEEDSPEQAAHQQVPVPSSTIPVQSLAPGGQTLVNASVPPQSTSAQNSA